VVYEAIDIGVDLIENSFLNIEIKVTDSSLIWVSLYLIRNIITCKTHTKKNKLGHGKKLEYLPTNPRRPLDHEIDYGRVRSSRDQSSYSHITPEAIMVVEKPSGRVPGRAPGFSRSRFDDGGDLQYVSRKSDPSLRFFPSRRLYR
jgi:hypothetical protein